MTFEELVAAFGEGKAQNDTMIRALREDRDRSNHERDEYKSSTSWCCSALRGSALDQRPHPVHALQLVGAYGNRRRFHAGARSPGATFLTDTAPERPQGRTAEQSGWPALAVGTALLAQLDAALSLQA